MRRLTAFGDRIAARDPDRQTAETQIRVAPNKRFNAFAPPGTPVGPNIKREP